MKTLISIFVKPKSKNTSIIKDKNMANHYIVKLKSPPCNGLANAELVKMLSEHFDIPKNNILIIRGSKNRKKIIRLLH